MRIIKETKKVYKFEELSQEAKDKAVENYNSDNQYSFLKENLTDYILENLKRLGFTIIKDINIFYSLSHSQGDGFMFEGIISDKDFNTYSIKQNGYCYHENSKIITGYNNEAEDIDVDDFDENIYIPLCLRAEKRGYEEIEYESSEEYFKDECEANEWEFLENGDMY